MKPPNANTWLEVVHPNSRHSKEHYRSTHTIDSEFESIFVTPTYFQNYYTILFASYGEVINFDSFTSNSPTPIRFFSSSKVDSTIPILIYSNFASFLLFFSFWKISPYPLRLSYRNCVKLVKNIFATIN